MISDKIEVTIAVLTYRRPAEVAAVVPMLVEQAQMVSDDAGSEVAATVLVVDNDGGGSARQIVAEHDDDRVRYVAEARPGIAAARNRALDEAKGADLLVFIDDDERPEPGWLLALVETWRDTRPAAVAGPVRTEYAGRLHPWIASGGFLSRAHRKDVRTGTEVAEAATNNLLLDLAQVEGTRLRFDEAFGISGGSDSLFTRGLHARGARIVWCAQAVVTERILADRMNARWMLARALRYGNTDVRVALSLRGSRSALGVRVGGVFGGIGRVGVGSARWVTGLLAGSVRTRARGAVTVARGGGMILAALGYIYREYRRA